MYIRMLIDVPQPKNGSPISQTSSLEQGESKARLINGVREKIDEYFGAIKVSKFHSGTH